ncbi:chorismate mutase [Chytriomyces confervae]|uniref:chorismate mutase n=1 Tax=Chytriomyces confervae TaxID=246404 RepID=A0A507EYN1_9FUNG|nr:chorismate mutase [Chytriomyces confervae]
MSEHGAAKRSIASTPVDLDMGEAGLECTFTDTGWFGNDDRHPNNKEECMFRPDTHLLSPDEYPFTSAEKIPKPVLPPLKFPQLLCPNNVNINNTIKQIYVEKFMPSLCKEGDDSNYGSQSTKDIEALRVLSRRIHFDEYTRLIEAKDCAGIEALLTNRAVEERLLKRVLPGQCLKNIQTTEDMVKLVTRAIQRDLSTVASD